MKEQYVVKAIVHVGGDCGTGGEIAIASKSYSNLDHRLYRFYATSGGCR